MELKAVASSTRWAILHATMQQPTKEWYSWELSEIVGLQQTSIYYHIKVLIEHGFLIATLDGVVNGIEERTFRAAQTRIEFHLGQPNGTEAPYSSGSQGASKAPKGTRQRSPIGRMSLL